MSQFHKLQVSHIHQIYQTHQCGLKKGFNKQKITTLSIIPTWNVMQATIQLETYCVKNEKQLTAL